MTDQSPRNLTTTRDSQPRTEVSMVCEVRQGMTPWELARVYDLTPGGVKLKWLGLIDPTSPLRLKLPGLQMLTCRVVWVDGQFIGLQFASPLHPAVFDHLVAQHLPG